MKSSIFLIEFSIEVIFYIILLKSVNNLQKEYINKFVVMIVLALLCCPSLIILKNNNFLKKYKKKIIIFSLISYESKINFL
jgi:hypothetical protein